MSQNNEFSTILNRMLLSYNTRWSAVEERLFLHPDEARVLDLDGNSVLYIALSRRIENYPPSRVVQKIIEAYPEAVWIGISSGKSALETACRRRASMQTLLAIMRERPAVTEDVNAIHSFWNSYCDLFGGEQELVNFLYEGTGEAVSIYSRLLRLMEYCTSFKEALKPFRGLHSVAYYSTDPELLRVMLALFPHQVCERCDDGDYPVHRVSYCYPLNGLDTINERLALVLDAYPAAIRIRNNQGDLPLHIALRRGLVDVRKFLEHYPDSIAEPDGTEGLLPFQLAAIAFEPSLDLVYDLIRKDPRLVYSGVNKKRKSFCMTQTKLKSLDAEELGVVCATVEVAIQGVGASRSESVWQSLRHVLARGTDAAAQTWYVCHAAAGLRFCPPAMLKVFVDFNERQLRLRDSQALLPLHHAVQSSKHEIRFWQITEHHNDDNSMDGSERELPVIRRIRALLEFHLGAASIRDKHGRTPLHLAASSGLTLKGLQLLVDACPEALCRKERKHLMVPALLCASCPIAGLDEVYFLIRSDPSVLRLQYMC